MLETTWTYFLFNHDGVIDRPPLQPQDFENGGTTLDDLAYLLPDGNAGENMSTLHVYAREGEACDNCGNAIERIVVRARSTHFCPDCQRAAS